jgi:hypothetical protein
MCALQAAQCSWERSTDAAAKVGAVQHVIKGSPERMPRLLLRKTAQTAQKDCLGNENDTDCLMDKRKALCVDCACTTAITCEFRVGAGRYTSELPCAATQAYACAALYPHCTAQSATVDLSFPTGDSCALV